MHNGKLKSLFCWRALMWKRLQYSTNISSFERCNDYDVKIICQSKSLVYGQAFYCLIIVVLFFSCFSRCICVLVHLRLSKLWSFDFQIVYISLLNFWFGVFLLLHLFVALTFCWLPCWYNFVYHFLINRGQKLRYLIEFSGFVCAYLVCFDTW